MWWPVPSFHASITSGFTASPAPTQWRRVGNRYFLSGSSTNIREGGGGGKKVGSGQGSNISSAAGGSNFFPRASQTKRAAPVFQGAKKQVHAAWAQPVSEIVQCASGGR